MQHKRHNDVFGYVPTIDIENESMQHMSVKLSGKNFRVLDHSDEGIAKAVVVSSSCSSVACLISDCALLCSDCKQLMRDCTVTAKCCKSDCGMTTKQGIQP